MQARVRCLFLVLFATSLFVGAQAVRSQDKPSRVIVVGDIHGELEGLESILRETGLIDQNNRWVGGTATFVQTGDILDRGPNVRKVLDLLMALQTQAEAQGGKAVVLMGNHEIMNLLGDLRDVTPEIFATFATKDSEQIRQDEFENWKKWLRKWARQRNKEPQFGGQTRDRWLAQHPPGYFEYRDALGPDGEYGRWLMALPIVSRIGDTLFQHAGISPTFANLSLAAINQTHAEEIRAFFAARGDLAEKGIVLESADLGELVVATRPENQPKRKIKYQQEIEDFFLQLQRTEELFLAPSSPLWYRGYSPPVPQRDYGLTNQELAAHLDVLETKHGAHYFVAAHSPMRGGEIHVRLDGRLFLIDTGMLSSYYGGRPSALEIENDTYTAIYVGERQVLTEARIDIVPAGASGAQRLTARPPTSSNRHAVWRGPRSQASYVADPQTPQQALPARTWLDMEGNLLPFNSHEVLLKFLETATIIDRAPLNVGKTGAERLTLRQGSVTARAVYHTINEVRNNPKEPTRLAPGKPSLYFRDSYQSQAAAYALSRVMGLDRVPPTTIRTIDGKRGSVALWIEHGTNLQSWRMSQDKELGDRPANLYFKRQEHDMYVWDSLVNNTDRNEQNIFWTDDGNMWLIDHTRTFARDVELRKPGAVGMCSRKLWSALNSLDEKQASAALKPYLSKYEIRALFKRNKALIKVIEQRARRKGEAKVFFNYGDPDPSLKISYSGS